MDAVLAYLDPGSGSMILQAILGGIAGVLVALKMFGRRLLGFLTFWRHDDSSPARAESKTDAG